MFPTIHNGSGVGDLKLYVRNSACKDRLAADLNVSSYLIDWYPIFFEACKDRSPTLAGVDTFGLSYSISLVAIATGVVVKKTGNYQILLYVGWVLTVVGAGLLTTLRSDSSMAKSIGFEIVIGCGLGVVSIVTMYPILASIQVSQTAPAMAFLIFARNFGNVCRFPKGIPSNGLLMDIQMLDLGYYHRWHYLAE